MRNDDNYKVEPGNGQIISNPLLIYDRLDSSARKMQTPYIQQLSNTEGVVVDHRKCVADYRTLHRRAQQNERSIMNSCTPPAGKGRFLHLNENAQREYIENIYRKIEDNYYFSDMIVWKIVEELAPVLGETVGNNEGG